MKIVCPNCNASYNFDEKTIPEKGLLVKCSACNNEFKVKKKSNEDNILERLKNEMELEAQANDENPLDELFSDFQENTPADADEVTGKNKITQKTEFKEAVADPEPVKPPQKAAVSEIDDLFSNFQEEKAESLREDEEKTRNFNTGVSGPSMKKENLIESHRFEEEEKTDPKQKKPDIKQSNIKTNSIDENEFLSDLFSDDPKETISLEKKILDQSFQQSEEEMPDTVQKKMPKAKSDRQVFFRNRLTNEIIGPYLESETGDLLKRKMISSKDFISYDSVKWEPLSGESSESLESIPNEYSHSQTTTKKSRLSVGASGAPAEEKTQFTTTENKLFDDLPAFDDDYEKKKDPAFVDHTHIPDGSPAALGKKTKKKGGSKLKAFMVSLVSLTVMAVLLIGGGYYYYKHKKKSNSNILEKISESIAENTGTLADVRDALNRDTRDDYIKSIGILRQYMKSDDIPAAVIGLDAQIKINLILSYNKKIEPMESLTDRVNQSYEKNKDNIDIAKAAALLHIIDKDFNKAAEVMQPFAEKNDPEVLYLLGVCAFNNKDKKTADTFFNASFIHSAGKSNKVAFAISEMKLEAGDAEGAMAFLNKIISASPYYMKAYLKKAQILTIDKNSSETALEFLKNINSKFISSADDTEKAQYYAMLADTYYKLENPQEAIAHYLKTIEIDKDNIPYLNKLADLYKETGNSSRALDFYNKVLTIDNKDIPAILGKAEVFILLKTNDKAYLELAKLDAKEISEPEHLLRLGYIYSTLDEKDSALSFFERTIKVKPSLVEPYLAETFIYLENNRIDDIRKIAEKMEQLSKGSYSYFLINGIIAHQDAEYNKADGFFEKALDLNRADDPKAYYYYGKLLFDQQKYNKSSAMLANAVKLDKEKYEYKEALAESLEKEKKFKEVIALFENFEVKTRKQYKSALMIANAYYNLKDYVNALKFIDAATVLNAKASLLFYKKAEILLAKGDLNPATSAIEMAIMLEIKSFENYLLFAKILVRKGDFKTAVEKVEEAERIDNSNPQLFLIKGIVYKNLDNYPEALKYFRKIKNNPDMVKEALVEIGECYMELNKEDEAIKYFLQAVQAGNYSAYSYLARIYYEKGNLDKAMLYYQKTLEFDKNNNASIKQLGYIYKEKKLYDRARQYFKRYLKMISETDSERKMIEDEIYYIEQNIPQAKLNRIKKVEVEVEEEIKEAKNSGGNDDAGEDVKAVYMEGLSLKESDPTTARRLFRKVMDLAPAGTKYYDKAKKALGGM